MPIWAWILIGLIYAVGGICLDMRTNKNKTNKQKKSNGVSVSSSSKSVKLEHTTCVEENINECFHVDGKEYSHDRKICKKCGHRNDVSNSKCSVCGHKLPWF